MDHRPLIAIHQPNFFPWIGYFAKIHLADHFVFLDDVPFSSPSFTKRCVIPHPDPEIETDYLTVPVKNAPIPTPINKIDADGIDWVHLHLNILRDRYRHATYYKRVLPRIEHFYSLVKESKRISVWNEKVTKEICKWLKISATFSRSSHYDFHGKKESYLIEITRFLNGGAYLSGMGAKKYQDPFRFSEAEVRLIYFDTRTFIKEHPYPRSGDRFIPGLSIMDPLFHIGPEETSTLICAASLRS